MPPLAPIPGRINRNFRNYMETFPFFAAAVLTAQTAGIHDELTFWGSIACIGGRVAYSALYISGNTAHPLVVLEHRRLWHARGPGGAFRARQRPDPGKLTDEIRTFMAGARACRLTPAPQG